MQFDIRPAGPESWEDFAALFAEGPNACWCMWPRVPVGAMNGRPPEQNREEARRTLARGGPAGLLAYRDTVPVGWLALAPRSHFGRLAPGEPSTWVIACVYVASSGRGAALLPQLLAAAITQARLSGATSLEAIPRGWRPDGGARALPSLRKALLSAGFEEVDPLALGVLFRRGL
jgi:hypothetical protein